MPAGGVQSAPVPVLVIPVDVDVVIPVPVVTPGPAGPFTDPVVVALPPAPPAFPPLPLHAINQALPVSSVTPAKTKLVCFILRR